MQDRPNPYIQELRMGMPRTVRPPLQHEGVGRALGRVYAPASTRDLPCDIMALLDKMR